MRKIIQFQTIQKENGQIVFGLCDDGTMWAICDTEEQWWALPEIPQGSVGFNNNLKKLRGMR